MFTPMYASLDSHYNNINALMSKVEAMLHYDHRHVSNTDCLKARTACLVCFISTVNGRSKKKKKLSLGRPGLVAGT
jgi:hypothetical protein